MSARAPHFGLLAEFQGPHELVEAARRVRSEGYREVDAFTPYPVEELSEALHLGRSHIPKIVLAGGIVGALGGYGLEYWASVVAYPLNIGGRPLHSWPAFIPPAFETTVLLAALAAVVGMLALNGLPQPYHPVFNVEAFERASRDRFFLCVESRDAKFDPEATRRLLESLGPVKVLEVEA
jgi:hypothetical protein